MRMGMRTWDWHMRLAQVSRPYSFAQSYSHFGRVKHLPTPQLEMLHLPTPILGLGRLSDLWFTTNFLVCAFYTALQLQLARGPFIC